jgi:hypothetical protein
MSSFFETLVKRLGEGNGGERQMLCHFHDGSSKIIRTSHGRSTAKAKGNQKEAPQDEREEITRSSVAVGGFCQPQPYINLQCM